MSVGATGVRRILVPLADEPIDGATLQKVFDLAQTAGSTVRLLYVRAARLSSEGREGPPWPDPAPIAARSTGVPVQCVVRFGDVNTAILHEAARWPADVVALTAGDPGWLSRVVRSGRAPAVFGNRGIPALLYTPRAIPSAA
jgi:nucleotide-binding universal stress UspA family protein